MSYQTPQQMPIKSDQNTHNPSDAETLLIVKDKNWMAKTWTLVFVDFFRCMK